VTEVAALEAMLDSSDVHEFSAVLDEAGLLEPGAAIDAYAHADPLCVCTKELRDSPSALTYRWSNDEDPQVPLTLRTDYRRRHQTHPQSQLRRWSLNSHPDSKRQF
jgi:hypothetical protein